LNGDKRSTWRLFDDKDLSVGDEVAFLIWETGEEFARVRITNVTETAFGKLTDADWEGHEKYASEQEMYETFSRYYDRSVDEMSPVKIIAFDMIQG
jgi:hypothetical protein